MAHALGRVVTVTALVALGWIIGLAQSTQPDFEIVVSAPTGQTTIQCVRGCDLSFVEGGVNPQAVATPKFTFSCGGPAARCSSARIGGWMRK